MTLKPNFVFDNFGISWKKRIINLHVYDARTLRLQRSLSLMFLLHKESPRTACMGNRRRYWSLIKVENAIDVSFVLLVPFNQFQHPQKRKKEKELFGYTELKRTKRLTTTELKFCAVSKSLCDARDLPRRPKSSHLERHNRYNWTLLYGSWPCCCIDYWGNLLYLAIAILRSLNPEWHGFSFFNALHAFTSRSITVVNSNRQVYFDETRRYSVL